MRCDFLRRVRGFTIAETLVALAVFSFSVLGIVMALDATIGAARTMQRESLIRGELQSRLAILSNRPAREFSAKADVNADGVTYQEIVIPEQIQQENATVLAGFLKVSVTARWMDRGEPQEWELSHLEYRP